MSYSDMVIFGFAVLNIAWNITEAKKKPIRSLVFGTLWIGLATSIVLGIKIS